MAVGFCQQAAVPVSLDSLLLIIAVTELVVAIVAAAYCCFIIAEDNRSSAPVSGLIRTVFSIQTLIGVVILFIQEFPFPPLCQIKLHSIYYKSHTPYNHNL